MSFANSATEQQPPPPKKKGWKDFTYSLKPIQWVVLAFLATTNKLIGFQHSFLHNLRARENFQPLCGGVLCSD